MPESIDLEISLQRSGVSATAGSSNAAYIIEFRYSQPESETEVRLSQAQPALATFDWDGLRAALDPDDYGKLLTQGLFCDPGVKTAFAQARAAAGSLDLPIRLRLLIGATAPELHTLHWETLRDPQDGTPLATSENIYFTRYLSSQEWRPVRLRPKGDLRALVAIANPSDLASYQAASIDTAGELARAKAGLGAISLTALGTEGCGPVTLDALVAGMRDGCDVLYLTAHGLFAQNDTWLFLQNEAGAVERVAGSDLVTRLKELQVRPSLVVLVACQSAGSGATPGASSVAPATPPGAAPSAPTGAAAAASTAPAPTGAAASAFETAGQALFALGPRLAEAGVPAVIAMQGSVSMQTMAGFLPVFFKELQRDGQLDRAMAAARGAVRARDDCWMPVLFMRLKNGRIWYVPGFGDDHGGFEKWPALLRSIKRGQCTPILGHGLVEPLVGSLREIAQRWAETYRYPLAPYERESLPQVAQYLTIQQDPRFPYDSLGDWLCQELQTRFGSRLPPEYTQASVPLHQLWAAAGALCRHDDPNEIHRVLAGLPLPIFITTNVDSELEEALEEAGKKPEVVLCPWNRYIERIESVYDREKDYQPSADRPLVYHLFGRLDEPDSLVLTEDDYFDYLIGVTSNKDLIPPAVRRALTDTALLFLGFQVNDWSFRVLFRSILSKAGGERRVAYTHIAAQIEPEEGRNLEPDGARRYLEDYFFQDARINLYWGSVEDFAREFSTHWAESNQPGGQP